VCVCVCVRVCVGVRKHHEKEKGERIATSNATRDDKLHKRATYFVGVLQVNVECRVKPVCHTTWACK
jgi:hypothetical protein